MRDRYSFVSQAPCFLAITSTHQALKAFARLASAVLNFRATIALVFRFKIFFNIFPLHRAICSCGLPRSAQLRPTENSLLAFRVRFRLCDKAHRFLAIASHTKPSRRSLDYCPLLAFRVRFRLCDKASRFLAIASHTKPSRRSLGLRLLLALRVAKKYVFVF